MKCPVDQADLQIMERQNVEIDYCPRCRGVWLDRGELDKIIERVAGDLSGPSTRPVQRREHDDRYRQQPGYQQSGYGYRRDYDDDDDDRHRRGRRRGWFDDLFDFD